jgi:hypothetical protein
VPNDDTCVQACSKERARPPVSLRDSVDVVVVALVGLDGVSEFFLECAADESSDAVCLPSGGLHEFCEGGAVLSAEEGDDGYSSENLGR